MKMKNIYSIALILCPVIFFISCNKKADATIEYAVQEFDIILEGPIFKGSNEAQVNLAFSPDELLKNSGFEKKDIKDIKIKSVTLSIEEEENFNMFESLVIQLVGGKSSLTPIAVISPVTENVSQQTPVVTKEASLAEFKDTDSFYFVIDANLKDEYEENIKLKGNMVFNLELIKE